MNLKLNKPLRIELIYFLLTAILVSPLFPFLGYFNTAQFFIIIGVLVLLAINKKENLLKLSLVDFGFLLIGLSLGISFLKALLISGSIPIGRNYMSLLMMIAAYFSCQLLGKTVNYLKYFSNLFFGIFISLSVYVLLTAYQFDYNYAMLTSKFNYLNGVGNISQIAIYFSFYLIGIFYTQKNKWILFFCALLSIILAFILHSKLIFLVLLFLVVDEILSRFNSKVKVVSFATLTIVGIGCLGLFRPASLDGRAKLIFINLNHFDFSNFWGLGVGNYSKYINTVFVNDNAINTIGFIDDLAFNDFAQIFLELGYSGIIGLILILVGGVSSKNVFFVGAMAIVLLFMYPLQYLESAVLFGFLIFLLQPEQKEKDNPKNRFKYFSLKRIMIVLCSLLLCYSTYEFTIFQNWANLDSLLSNNEKIHTNLRKYKDLEYYLSNNDEYYLRFGIHLLKNKKYNDALRSFEKARAINPTYESFIHLGDASFEKRDFEKSLNYYKKSLLIRPEYLYPVYKSVFSLRKLGRNKEAEKYWLELKGNYTQLKGPKMFIMHEEIEKLLSSND